MTKIEIILLEVQRKHKKVKKVFVSPLEKNETMLSFFCIVMHSFFLRETV